MTLDFNWHLMTQNSDRSCAEYNLACVLAYMLLRFVKHIRVEMMEDSCSEFTLRFKAG